MSFRQRILLSCLAVPAMTALTAGSAWTQAPVRPTFPTRIGWLTLDGYYSHYRLDASRKTAVDMTGLGARLMWHPSIGSEDASPIPPRAALGLFVEHAPEQRLGFTLLHAGVQGDLSVMASPLYGRVEPLLSLSIGALRTGTI